MGAGMKWVMALAGAIVGYFCVVIPSCRWFWPESNLCGILFPFGMAAGAAAGYWLGARVPR